VQKLEKMKTKLVREILWRSENGRYVVVCGPFPEGFTRSETRDSWEKASRLDRYDIISRGETTKSTHYAKVEAKDILEVTPGETNNFGPVVP
jgi:hypothetical protein